MDKFSDIVNKAREYFELNSGNILIVQKYDEEWSEYIDCDSFAQINTGDKLKIILNQTWKSDDGQDISLVSNYTFPQHYQLMQFEHSKPFFILLMHSLNMIWFELYVLIVKYCQ